MSGLLQTIMATPIVRFLLSPTAQAFFVTVATILGTGILGLPVKLAEAGLGPTVCVLSLVLVMQIAVVCMAAELLQVARGLQFAQLQQYQLARKQILLEQQQEQMENAAGIGGVVDAIRVIDDDEMESSSSSTMSITTTSTPPRINNTTRSTTGGGSISTDLPPPSTPFRITPGRNILRTSLAIAAARQHHNTSSSSSSSSSLITLHTLSVLFLRPQERTTFTVAVVLHLLSILVSYALAGSFAMTQLFGLSPTSQPLLIAPFVAVLTFFLLAFAKRIQPIVTLLTALKMVLILIMMCAVAVIATASGVQHPTPTNGWNAIAAPFLLGTVALGGVVNTMPLMAAKFAEDKKGVGGGGGGGHLLTQQQQRSFVTAVIAGLVLCWSFNLLWATLVLNIVPQTRAQALALGLPTSLEEAAQFGQISTVPISIIVAAKFPSYMWISSAVSIFIALSISVSFLVMGAGLKHMLDGVAAHWAQGGGGGVATSSRGSSSSSSSSSSHQPGMTTISSIMGGGGVSHNENTASNSNSNKNAGFDDSSAMMTMNATPSGHSAVVVMEMTRKEDGNSSMSVIPGGGGSSTGGKNKPDLAFAPLTPALTQTHMSIAHTLAAAGIIARLADEEARLHLFLDEHGFGDDDEEETEGDDLDDERRRVLNMSAGDDADTVELTLPSSSSSSSNAATGVSGINRTASSPATSGTSSSSSSGAHTNTQRLNNNYNRPSMRSRSLRTAHKLVAIANWLMDLSGLLAAFALGMAKIPLRYVWFKFRTFVAKKFPNLLCERGFRQSLYSAAFGTVLILAAANPSGFLKSLEMFTSLALNLSCGFFVAMMYFHSKSSSWVPGVGDDNRNLQSSATNTLNNIDASGKHITPGSRSSNTLDHHASAIKRNKSSKDGSIITGVIEAGSKKDDDIHLGEETYENESKHTVVLQATVDTPEGGATPPVAAATRAATTTTTTTIIADLDSPDSSLPSPSTSSWKLTPFWAFCVPTFAVLTFGFAIVYDILDVAAHTLGWPAALWLFAAFCDWVWQTKYSIDTVAKVLNHLSPYENGIGRIGNTRRNADLDEAENVHLVSSTATTPRDLSSLNSTPRPHIFSSSHTSSKRKSPSQQQHQHRNNNNNNNNAFANRFHQVDPFPRLAIWANIAIFECLAVWHWDSCETGGGYGSGFYSSSSISDEAEHERKLSAVGTVLVTLLSAVLLNEIGTWFAAASTARPLHPLYAKIPVVFSYGAGMCIIAGATFLSAQGCGASALAWWAFLVQMASTAAAYISSVAKEETLAVLLQQH